MPSFLRAVRHRPVAHQNRREADRLAADLARSQACLQAARVNLRHIR